MIDPNFKVSVFHSDFFSCVLIVFGSHFFPKFWLFCFFYRCCTLPMGEEKDPTYERERLVEGQATC